MGHAHSKQRAEIEKTIREVKDIQAFIRKNSDEFDDESRDNLHRRLIEYSKALQDIFESAKKKNSKECKDATKFIAKVIEELYQQGPLDSGSVETNSFIHVSGKDAKLMSSNESLNKDKKQPRQKKDLMSHEKFRIPSLEEIKDKTYSLKPEIENSIRNEDINQLLVQQKIVQILATDLEMITFEAHSPLQETKEDLEKDLSQMYRKIERAKKRNSDAAQLRQQREARESIGELANINTRMDQIMRMAHALIKEKRFSDLMKARDEVIDFKSKLDTITNKNEEVLKMKAEVDHKIDEVAFHLSKQIGDNKSMAIVMNSEEKVKIPDDKVSENVADITKISSNIDQCISKAHILVKEKSFTDLLELKNQVLQDKSKLHESQSTDRNIMIARSEVELKINNALEYLDKQIDSSGVAKRKKKTEENLEKAEILITECREDIRKFDQSTNKSDYGTYNKHLDGLENFLNKITINEPNIMRKKANCLKIISECRQFLRNKFQEYVAYETEEDKSKVNETSASNSSTLNLTPSKAEDDKQQNNEEKSGDDSYEDDVVFRKPLKASKNSINEVRTIDGFYSYWKDLQSNLPAFNCTYDELKQIALLLYDIEEQIRQKRSHIEHFLQKKQDGKHIANQEIGSQFMHNMKVIDEIDSTAVKTNVKIYKLNEPKHLIIDDEEIIQNIDEINKQSKRIMKQLPQRVILPSESSVTGSSKEEVISKSIVVEDSSEKKETSPKAYSDESIVNKNRDDKMKVMDPKIPNNSNNSVANASKKECVSKSVGAKDHFEEKSPQNYVLDNKLAIKKHSHDKVEENAVLSPKSPKEQRSRQNVEYISQVQNIATSVEYLREKATTFSGSKQTPKYSEIKRKLDSYRKTLNILGTYQNENIKLSCSRVLENIDQVFEILNSRSEEQDMNLSKFQAVKRNTIESLFTDIMDIKSRIEEINKTIDTFEDPVENEIFLSIKDELLRNRYVLNQMKISKSYEVIAKSKAEVMQQIQENLYNLDMKLEENKIRHKHKLYQNRNSNEQKIISDFQKVKDKVNRFSGTYKNVLYKEIEKSIEKSLNTARDSTKDASFLQNLNEDATKYLKILEEKAIKDYSDTIENTISDINETDKETRNSPTEIAIQLSRMRQNYKDIRDKIYGTEPLNLEVNKELEHRINLNVLELSSINITVNEPFYFDKEKLREDFLKLSSITKDNITALEGDRPAADGQSNSQTTTLRGDKNDVEEELSNIEKHLKLLQEKIDNFSDERSSVDFFNIDEGLTRLSMNVDKFPTKKGTDVHKKKLRLLKTIYECCEILENKAQSYEILQNIEKKMTEVKYRLDNFQNLSDGDYNALYKELIDLDMALKDLSVSDNTADKKLACQANIKQCLAIIEERDNHGSDDDYGSDDGTFV